MNENKTIAAISTGNAPGGIGIVRISGTDAINIGQRIFKAKSGIPLASMKGYQAALGVAVNKNDEKLDEVIALLFRTPKSYTGEDLLEISCHGGILITNLLLKAAIDFGAYPAEPGEFTKRAFLNGKIDLLQAESVMKMIQASGEIALKTARSGQNNALNRKIENLKSDLLKINAHLSAWADFPDEDIPQIDEGMLKTEMARISEIMEYLILDYEKSKVVEYGIETIIIGKTNVGKSTLMNLISGSKRSIVTHYPGTTRDVIENRVVVGNMPLRLVDTAGIRVTSDPVEKIGVSISRERLKNGQLILAVFDRSRLLDQDDLDVIKMLDPNHTVVVLNKTDKKTILDLDIFKLFPHIVSISASNEDGLDNLIEEILLVLQSYNFDPSSGVIYTERQKRDVLNAHKNIIEALEALRLRLTLDAITICIEEALKAICNLTGENISEAIVDEVFSTFCVGK